MLRVRHLLYLRRFRLKWFAVGMKLTGKKLPVRYSIVSVPLYLFRIRIRPSKAIRMLIPDLVANFFFFSDASTGTLQQLELGFNVL
jgi:hypothetical protein